MEEIEQAQQNQPRPQEIQTSEEFTPSVRSLIFGNPKHSPTALQTQLLYNYITDEEGRTPPALLREMGKAPEMWWIWPKRHPGFLDWWNSIVHHVFAEHRLNDLYNALYRRGTKHDTAAAKIVIQRFDPRFAERSTQDQRHSFQGYEPKAAENSRERQRKALAEQSLTALPVVEVDAREALPGPQQGTPTDAHALDDNAHIGAIGGVAPISPPSTPRIHAQSQSAEPIEPEPTPPSIDKTIDTEPITGIDPQGGD